MAKTIEQRFGSDHIAAALRYSTAVPPAEIDPRVAVLVNELIGRIADKWTMLILDALAEQGTLRFTQLGKELTGISQKMLTQTLRAMERDGFVARKIYPVVPPKVEYSLTGLGFTLSAAFCGVWIWASDNLDAVDAARHGFDKRLIETR